MPRPFKHVRTANPGRSAFDLSYVKLMTADMGILYPVMVDEAVPGDSWTIGNEIVVRMMPLVAPVLHPIKCYVHYFFVPYRLLWPEPAGWETFITGGVDGDDVSVVPRWPAIVGPEVDYGTLWDYLGFPPQVDPAGAHPLDFPRRAYALIWNEFYRDENWQDAIDIDGAGNVDLLRRCWTKDYFTSALPWQQRGTAVALPLSGTAPVEFDDGGGAPLPFLYAEDDGIGMTTQVRISEPVLDPGPHAEVNFANAATFDVSDLRLAFQIQKWMERNARAGVRYIEFIASHFGAGVAPRDDRLQRPEYIGGSVSDIIVSEVLQTSETAGTPQGTMAGHGITVDQRLAGKYFAREYGLIMGLMSIMPVPMYHQGINRQWLRRSRYDFFFPEFANLSEQSIETCEIFADPVEATNLEPFGFQGRYDEMRYKPNMICGLMHTTFDYWHLARTFASAPVLDPTFLECEPDKRIFASESDPGFIVSVGNLLKAVRPLPIIAEPGLIDHG